MCNRIYGGMHGVELVTMVLVLEQVTYPAVVTKTVALRIVAGVALGWI